MSTPLGFTICFRDGFCVFCGTFSLSPAGAPSARRGAVAVGAATGASKRSVSSSVVAPASGTSPETDSAPTVAASAASPTASPPPAASPVAPPSPSPPPPAAAAQARRRPKSLPRDAEMEAPEQFLRLLEDQRRSFNELVKIQCHEWTLAAAACRRHAGAGRAGGIGDADEAAKKYRPLYELLERRVTLANAKQGLKVRPGLDFCRPAAETESETGACTYGEIIGSDLEDKTCTVEWVRPAGWVHRERRKKGTGYCVGKGGRYELALM